MTVVAREFGRAKQDFWNWDVDLLWGGRRPSDKADFVERLQFPFSPLGGATRA